MSVIQIYIKSVEVGQRLRKYDEAHAKNLAERIAQSGWLSPIGVTKDHRLVHGLHRLRACDMLGWTEIPAEVQDWNELKAQEIEIRENLDRLALSTLEEAQHLARLQEIHVALHPETAPVTERGGPGRGGKTSANNAPVCFTAELAATTGRSERSIQQDLQIARNLAPDVQEALVETPLAHAKIALLELSKETPDVQREVAAKVVASVKPFDPPPKPTPHKPLPEPKSGIPHRKIPCEPAQSATPKPTPAKPAAQAVRAAAAIAKEAAVAAKEKPPASDVGHVTLDAFKSLTPEQWQEVLAVPGGKSFNRQDTTSIEWAQFSWNPVTGCLHDCPYCYARDIANRFYPQGFEPSFYPDRLGAPGNTPVPGKAQDDVAYRNVFTCSMADLWGRWVPAEWIQAVLNVVRAASQWNFLFLTKFPRRMSEFDLPENAWVGTSVDCQARVKNAEAAFANVNAKVKWLSIEPMLEPLKFERLDLFHWVVIGGASKSNQTPEWMPPFEWVSNLHQQARAAGCRVYHKTNLGIHDSIRLREFPWGPQREQAKLPDSLCYLQSRTAPNQRPEGAS